MKKSHAKVLFATFDVVPDPTGTSARTTAFLRSLSPFLNLDAITLKTPGHAHIERYQGARLLRVPVGSGDIRSQGEAFGRAVRRQVQSEDYALVQFTDPFGGYALSELKPTLGYKLIYDARGFPSVELRYTDPQLEGDRKFMTKLRRQEIFCLMNADLVLASSKVAMGYIASLGVPSDKIHVLRPPVSAGAWSVPELEQSEPCRLLYLGSHASWQGLPSLLFALKKVACGAPFKARIIGPTHGSWRQQLEDMVREFELKELVTVEPPVPHEEVPALLAWAQIGVAPLMKVGRNTSQGATPVKLAEYLAAGRPAIAPDLPICLDYIEDGVTGLTYPAGDEDALAERITEACRSSDLRTKLGLGARELSRSSFDQNSYQTALLDLCDGLFEESSITGRISSVFDCSAPVVQPESDPTITLPAASRSSEPGPFTPITEAKARASLDSSRIELPLQQEEATGAVDVASILWPDADSANARDSRGADATTSSPDVRHSTPVEEITGTDLTAKSIEPAPPFPAEEQEATSAGSPGELEAGSNQSGKGDGRVLADHLDTDQEGTESMVRPHAEPPPSTALVASPDFPSRVEIEASSSGCSIPESPEGPTPTQPPPDDEAIWDKSPVSAEMTSAHPGEAESATDRDSESRANAPPPVDPSSANVEEPNGPESSEPSGTDSADESCSTKQSSCLVPSEETPQAKAGDSATLRHPPAAAEEVASTKDADNSDAKPPIEGDTSPGRGP